MWIDRSNHNFRHEAHAVDWTVINVPPEEFKKATFYAPTDPNGGGPVIDGCNVTAYGWALRDVLAQNLLLYLFAEDDISDVMRIAVLDLADLLTEADGRTLRNIGPQTWRELLAWMTEEGRNLLQARNHTAGTVAAIFRRLRGVIQDGEQIFLLDARRGSPLCVTRMTTTPPQVIDIHSLPGALQRFVVAAISKQVVAARIGRSAVSGLCYIILLDELNRFAPRGGRDPITRLIEEIATERRSQGIILFGAQQFASEVSTKVVESASIRVLGRTGSAEMADQVWKAWSPSTRRQAGQLRQEEKLVMQPTFREPMLVEIPFPAWAMRRVDIAAPRIEDTPEV
jgi:hypothetical protein